jgi:pimeloyl-ACP methyl ester carboxylesterase
MSRVVALLCLLVAAAGGLQTRQTLTIRGHDQTLRLYGDAATGDPVVVTSGDGGWIHLAPHVAEFLSAHRYFVVGFDARAYLSSFTTATSTVRPADEPADYLLITRLASRASGKKPILIGVSEGAGLSVLAATDPRTKDEVGGVVGIGLPDFSELGWRWKDMLIYLTHRAPNEPGFSAAAVVGRMAPLPLAAIHSSHDEFVPAGEVQRVLANAKEPKRLWIVEATNHRFSGGLEQFDRALLDALEWIRAQRRP